MTPFLEEAGLCRVSGFRGLGVRVSGLELIPATCDIMTPFFEEAAFLGRTCDISFLSFV